MDSPGLLLLAKAVCDIREETLAWELVGRVMTLLLLRMLWSVMSAMPNLRKTRGAVLISMAAAIFPTKSGDVRRSCFVKQV